MRVNHEMSVMRQKVREKNLDGWGSTQGPGTFLLNGNQLNRTTIDKCNSHEYDKLLLCGTCGKLLATSRVAHCDRCQQVKIDKETFIGTLGEDWRRHKVSIQYSPSEKPVQRRDETDDVSSVSSGDRSYIVDWQKKYAEVPLSKSNRRELSTHRMPHPGEPDEKYRKFLSGIGLQLGNEKVYSQPERLWLPSRAGLTRSQNIAQGTVKLAGSPSKGGASLRQSGVGQDSSHGVFRASSTKTMRM